MEVPDSLIIRNRDWDPSYLSLLLSQDFYEFNDLWSSNVSDAELLNSEKEKNMYCPVGEDISMDDDTLCKAVEDIEME